MSRSRRCQIGKSFRGSGQSMEVCDAGATLADGGGFSGRRWESPFCSSTPIGSRVSIGSVGVAGFVAAVAVFALVRDTPAQAGFEPLVVGGAVFFLTGFLQGAFLLGYAVVKDRYPSNASGISTGTVNFGAFVGAAISPVACASTRRLAIGSRSLSPPPSARSRFAVRSGSLGLPHISRNLAAVTRIVPLEARFEFGLVERDEYRSPVRTGIGVLTVV